MNLEMKFELHRIFGSSSKAGKALGISDTSLSRIIHGYKKPSRMERQKLTRALGKEKYRELMKGS